ncbi:hypothetical protein ACTQ49_12110 [Luteococcus sp. Sow4_B9]|uniref:hypothetical protein n=1 Tax=Luteococcus sp. Sow4_B9 TaxID=3438792 RepID=UPI003F97C379
MNSLIRPTGPESENTYWVRRAIVLGAALVSLALIWWALSGLFGGGDDGPVQATPQNPTSLASAGMSPSASPSPSASSSPVSSESPASSRSASVSPEASASASSTPTPSVSSTPSPSPSVTTCAANALGVTVSGERVQKTGSASKLAISVKNSGPDCILDAQSTPISLVVTSGSDRIWTTEHCPAWAPKGGARIASGAQWQTSATWPGKRSAKDCTLRPDALKPGTYRATVQVGGGASATQVITLRG